MKFLGFVGNTESQNGKIGNVKDCRIVQEWGKECIWDNVNMVGYG